MRTKALTIIFGLLVATGAWLLDRVTKVIVIDGLVKQEPVFFSWLEITKHHNFGLLGNLPFPQWSIFVLIGLAMLLLLVGLFDALKNRSDYNFITLSIVLGGALGNLYDRLFFGYVFDWLMFFKSSIINFADAFITVGLILYAISHFKRQAEDKSLT